MNLVDEADLLALMEEKMRMPIPLKKKQRRRQNRIG